MAIIDDIMESALNPAKGKLLELRKSLTEQPHAPRTDNYQDVATEIFQENHPDLQGKREVFLFQKYFNRLHPAGEEIGLDGILGEDTIFATLSHPQATLIFLNTLDSNLNLSISEFYTQAGQDALKEELGIDIESLADISEDVVDIAVSAIDEIKNKSI